MQSATKSTSKVEKKEVTHKRMWSVNAVHQVMGRYVDGSKTPVSH